MNKKIAVFPGSFDPFTVGHQSLIERGLKIFDEIVVAIGVNSEKKSFFDIETRKKWIDELFSEEPRVKADVFSSLTVDFCKKVGADFILRGLRTSADFEFERQIGQMNKNLYENIETVFLLTSTEYTYISSSIVREIIKYKADISKFVPEIIAKHIEELRISNQ